MNPREWNDMLLSELGYDFTKRHQHEYRKPVALKTGGKFGKTRMKIIKPSRYMKASFEDIDQSDDSPLAASPQVRDPNGVRIYPTAMKRAVITIDSDDEDDVVAPTDITYIVIDSDDEDDVEDDTLAGNVEASPSQVRLNDAASSRETVQVGGGGISEGVSAWGEGEMESQFADLPLPPSDPSKVKEHYKEVQERMGVQINSPNDLQAKLELLQITYNQLTSLQYPPEQARDIITKSIVGEGKKQASLKEMQDRVTKLTLIPERGRLQAGLGRQALLKISKDSKDI